MKLQKIQIKILRAGNYTHKKHMHRHELGVRDLSAFPQLVPNSASFRWNKHLAVPSEILAFKRHRFCVQGVLFTMCGKLLISLYIYININDQDYTQQEKSGLLFSVANLRSFSRVI